MKKFFAIMAIAALASCGGSESTETVTDTTVVAPSTDTTVVSVDTTATPDTLKAVADTTKK